MTRLDQAVLVVSGLLATAALAGLVRRDRLRACRLFGVYLVVAAAGALLMAVFPGMFWTWEFYAATDVLQTSLRVGIALELSWRVFRPLPLGPRRVGPALLLVLLASGLALAFYPKPIGNAFELAVFVDALSYGVAWLFGVFLLLTLYYGVPLDPLHRDLAAGFGAVSFLLVYQQPLTSLDPYLGRDFVVKMLYPLLLAAWNVSAWRREDFGRLEAETVRVLQPWRVPR